MATGFVERVKGKIIQPASSLTNFGVGGATFRGGGNIYTNQSAAGIGIPGAVTTEQTLDTFSLPANSLDIPGRALLITAFGSTSGNTHVKTAKVYFGTASITTGSMAVATGTAWVLQMMVMKDAANSQTVNGQSIYSTTHGGCTVAAGTETDTAAVTIKVTGQTGTAQTSDVILNGWMIEGIN